MNANIKIILLDFVSNPAITASWGISNIQVTDEQILFEVSAFKYIGKVIITDVGEFVRITLVQNHTEFSTKPNLVLSAIDNMIESDGNYRENLKNWIVNKIS